MERGNWLIVQNCNFSVSFLYETEYLLEQANGNWHSNFRLWLIFNENSLENKSFPVSLLLRSLKGYFFIYLNPHINYYSNILKINQ